MTGLWPFYLCRWIFRIMSPLRRVVDDALTNAVECCVVPYDVFFEGQVSNRYGESSRADDESLGVKARHWK